MEESVFGVTMKNLFTTKDTKSVFTKDTKGVSQRTKRDLIITESYLII